MNYPFPSGNEVWEPVDIIALLCQPGYMSPDDWRPVTGCAVVLAESGGNPLAVGSVIWNPGKVTHLSVDLGIFQLNSYYQTVVDPYPDVPRITMAQAFDPFEAWKHSWKLINKERSSWNYNWNNWNVYKTGAYNEHISSALSGMRNYRVNQGLSKGVFG